VKLTEPILSRFDILCIVRDTVDSVADERLARFVVGSHARSHPLSLSNDLADSLQGIDGLGNLLSSGIGGINSVIPIDQELLRKYIRYAKVNIRPELSSMDVDKVSRLYADLRRESMATGSIPITVRHIESVVRMAEASAKMHLRSNVRADDLDVAIRMMLDSFIQSQKYSVMSHLKRVFSKYILNRTNGKEQGELLLFALKDLFTRQQHQNGHQSSTLPRNGGGLPNEDDSGSKMVSIDLADFVSRAHELNIYDVKAFLKSSVFLAAGYSISGNQIIMNSAV
jgi:DNA replication licensing factor MCM2